MTFEHNETLEAAYALQLILDAAPLAIGIPKVYRMPDALTEFCEKSLKAAESGEWGEEDAERLMGSIAKVLDTLAESLWESLGEDPRGWEKPCSHPECIAHRDQLQAAEGAGDEALEQFLKELGLEL